MTATAPPAAAELLGSPSAASTSRARVLLSVLLVVLLAVIGAVVATPQPAGAENDYPSWNDVKKARSNEKAKRAEVTRINRLIANLEREIAAAEKIAQEAGERYFDALQAYDAAAFEAEQLDARAKEAQQEADAATERAGMLLAQLGRGGAADPTLQLMLSAGQADDLLYRLGTIQQLGNQTSSILDQAEAARNTAEALFDQAEVAKAELERLKDIAEAEFEKAQAAQQALERKQLQHEQTLSTLRAQLSALTDSRKKIEKAYLDSILEHGIYPNYNGFVSSKGWVRPLKGGWISDVWRWRSSTRFHYGTDIAASQGTIMYAATSGTVIYRGYYGGYGNHIQIRHANGIVTSYSHIMNGGFIVRSGQNVQAGQPIAKVGSTGNSTGPHLHIETRVNGTLKNPQTVFKQNGITL